MLWSRSVIALVLIGIAGALTMPGHPPARAAKVAAASSPLPAPPTKPDPWRSAANLFFKVAARDDAIPDAGLPRAAAQDAAGFVWLATDAGLARWDGTAFKTYSTDARDGAGALPELMVNLVFADAAGRLWLGMNAEGVLWHDPASEQFRRPPNRTPLDSAHVTAISDDGVGGLWVGSDKGLAHIAASDHRVTPVAPTTANRLPREVVQAVTVDRARTLWVAMGSRLLRRPHGTQAFTAIPLPQGPEDTITALYADRHDRLWVATAKSGFRVIEPTGRIRRIPAGDDGQPAALGAMVETANGEIWATSRSGIWIAGPGTTRARRLAHDADVVGSLPENGLNSLMRDRSGSIWAVGDSSLSYVDPAPHRVLGIVDALRRDGNPAPDTAWAVAAAPDGSLWYGSVDTPAARLIPMPDGRIAPPRQVPGARRDVHGFAFPTGRGAFTAGADGLFQMTLDGRAVRRLSPRPWWRMLVHGNTLYVGGLGVATVDLRHPGAPVPTPWSSALSDQRVRSLAITTDGSIWVGTGRGLNRVDPATGAVTQIVRRTDTPRTLRGNMVSTLLEDRQGRLWAGTIGGGITIFARGAQGWGIVAQLGRRDGLPHDTVDKLLLGPDGAVWASTDGGIARVDPHRLVVSSLRAADGAAFTAHWTGAGDRLADGRMVFAGFGGLTIVDPAAPSRRQADAPLRFTAVQGGGQTVLPAAGVTAVTIDSGADRSLTAEFARLDFTASKDQVYAYRLLPLERGWTQVDAAHRVARYTNLPPGRSTLEVRAMAMAAGGSMQVVGPPLLLTLDVKHRWFETTLFRGAAVVLIGALLFALFHLRLRSARKREALLGRQVERRTAELLASQSELQKLAYSDTLTGLGNRRLYGEVVHRHLANAHRQPFVLLLIDLDRFKQVNDALGHDVGDALLVEVADRLTTAIRQQDSIFRLGGDEFAVVVERVENAAAVADICDRLYTAFASPVAANDHQVPVALSIGAVIVAGEDQSIETIYKQADLALYDAKRSGRGTWRLTGTVA